MDHLVLKDEFKRKQALIFKKIKTRTMTENWSAKFLQLTEIQPVALRLEQSPSITMVAGAPADN